MQDLVPRKERAFMCAFDIKSLYTNIPLREVIKICVSSLYDDEDIDPPQFSREIFKGFLEFATCALEYVPSR